MRILIIDDERILTDFLKPSLEDEGYTVDIAEDGKDGYYLAETNGYDLIILDLNLPKESGCDICRKLRADGFDVPILVLSAKTELPDKIGLLNMGADDYMTKPFSFEELLARIQAISRRPKTIEAHETIKIDDIEIDTSNQRVSRNGQDIFLRQKEYNILLYLAKHKNQVVTRATLMEKFWDVHANPLSNTIETHISILRDHLSKAGCENMILTVPKRGYKLVSTK